MKNLLMVILLTLFTVSLTACGSGGSGDSFVSSSTASTPSGTPTTPSGTPSTLHDLGDLVDGSGDNWYYTNAVKINDSRQIVGQSNAGWVVKGAFLWDYDTDEMTFLGIHDGTYDGTKEFIYSEAVDINNAGAIICNSTTGTGWPEETEKRAFYRSPSGDLMDLAPVTSNGEGTFYIGKFSDAVDINDKGEVVLTVEDSTGTHAYYWDGDFANTVTTPVGDVPNLELLGRIIGQDAKAVAINENSQAVINSGNSAVFHDLNADVIEVLNALPGASSTC